jgi:hypothetical protein
VWQEVDLKNLQISGIRRTAQCETVEARADQNILPNSPGYRGLQCVLRIPRASDDVGIGAAAQQRFILDFFARGFGHETIAPGIIDQGLRVKPRVRRTHQRRGKCGPAG